MPTNDSAHQEHAHWWLLLLLVGTFAFGFRYYYVTHAEVLQPVNQPNVRGDAVEYYVYAKNLTTYGVFSRSPEGTTLPVSDSFRDPGYPLFLAGWLMAFKQWSTWYAAVLISQSLLGALTVVLLMSFGRRWMPTRWLATAGTLMAIWPHSVAISSYLLSETLFGFLCALGLFLLGRALEKDSAGWSVISGIGFSLAAMTNAVLLPFAFLLSIYMLIRRKMSKAMAISIIAGALCVTLPWTIRNANLPQGNVSSSGRALMNLVQGSWPLYHGAFQASMRGDPQAAGVMAAASHEISVTLANPMAGVELMAARMVQSPGAYIRWYLSKPALLWSWDIRVGQGDIYVYPTRNSPFELEPAYRAIAAISHASNIWLFVLAAFGSMLALVPNQRAPSSASAAALLLIFVTLVYSLLQSEPRYSTPFRGIELMLAVFAVYRIKHWVDVTNLFFAGQGFRDRDRKL